MPPGHAELSSRHPIEEETPHISCGWDLPDLFDIALPAQQWSRSQGAVFGDVIAVVDPGPEAGIERFQRGGLFAIQMGQELLLRASIAKDLIEGQGEPSPARELLRHRFLLRIGTTLLVYRPRG